MGIQVTSNAKTRPALVYDKVHVNSLNIKQPVYDDDTIQPVYGLEIFFQYFGVDENNVRHYLDEVHRVSIDDYITKASEDASNGDTTLIDALSSIETAIANIIADQKEITTQVN